MPNPRGLGENSSPTESFFKQRDIAHINAVGRTKLDKEAAALETGFQQDKNIQLEPSLTYSP